MNGAARIIVSLANRRRPSPAMGAVYDRGLRRGQGSVAEIFRRGVTRTSDDLDHPLADILAGEEADERRRKTLEAIDDVFAHFDFS
jgi:hypothetical protein